MKRFALIILALFPLLSFAQSSNVCGVKVYKGDQTSTDSTIKEFVKVRALTDGTVIHGGQADEGADANFSLTKTSSDGAIIWQKVYGTDKLDVLKNFIVTSDGGFLMVGWTTGTGSSDPSDAIAIKVDAQGEILWSIQIGGADDDEGFNATEMTNGDFIITGTTFSFGPRLKNAFATKVTSSGEIVWSKAFAKGSYNYFINAVALPNNEAILCGYTWVTTGNTIFDPMFVKIQADGSVTWARWVKMNSSQVVYDYEKDLDGGIVYSGVSTTSGANQNFIAKLSPEGNHSWAKLFGTSFGDRIWDLAVLPSGDYITVGFTDKNGTDTSPRNAFIARVSSAGTVQESIQYGAANDTSTSTFTGVTISGDYAIATGFTYDFGNISGAGFTSRLPAYDLSQNCSSIQVTMPSTSLSGIDSAGIFVEDGGTVVESASVSGLNNLVVTEICTFTEISGKIQSTQPDFYPNPSNGLFYSNLSTSGESAISVFAIDGRKILSQKLNGSQLTIDLRKFNPGLYHAVIETAGNRYTRTLEKR